VVKIRQEEFALRASEAAVGVPQGETIIALRRIEFPEVLRDYSQFIPQNQAVSAGHASRVSSQPQRCTKSLLGGAVIATGGITKGGFR
jgi:hypothetical protein